MSTSAEARATRAADVIRLQLQDISSSADSFVAVLLHEKALRESQTGGGVVRAHVRGGAKFGLRFARRAPHSEVRAASAKRMLKSVPSRASAA